MIKVEHIDKSFGKRHAVCDISFDVKQGEVLCFLGPNGAGKTTTMRMLTGCISPSSGKIFVNGIDIEKHPLGAKSCIGYLAENNPLYPFMTPFTFLKFAARAKGIPRSQRKRQIEAALEKCNLSDVSKRHIGKLSKGYRQRVGLAQALLGEPPVIILDEPTSGLDPKQIIEIRELIQGLRGKQSVIISTHILSEVSRISDRVLIINEGKFVAQGNTGDLASDLKLYEELELVVSGDRITLVHALKTVDGFISHKVTSDADGVLHALVRLKKGKDHRLRVSDALYKAGLKMLEFKSNHYSLEDVYLHLLTAEKNREDN